MKPTVGRIVHYQSYGTPGGEYTPQPRAAVITEVGQDDDPMTVGLCVLNPTGQFFNRDVEYSETPKPGHWSWPVIEKKESVSAGTATTTIVQVREIGWAVMLMKRGEKVRRAGWNGKGMWLAYSPGSTGLPAEKFWAKHNRQFAEENGGQADVLPCITMKTADGKILMGWLASQTDILATDWEIALD